MSVFTRIIICYFKYKIVYIRAEYLKPYNSVQMIYIWQEYLISNIYRQKL